MNWPASLAVFLPRWSVLLVALLLLRPSSQAFANPPCLEVTEITATGTSLSDENLALLGEFLSDMLASTGKYRVVLAPSLGRKVAEIKIRILQSSTYDAGRPIELGLDRPPEKAVRTTITRAGITCVTAASVIDLLTAVKESGASWRSGCSVDALYQAMEGIASRLTGGTASNSAAEPVEPPPGPPAAETSASPASTMHGRCSPRRLDDCLASCDQGVPTACADAGWFLWYGIGSRQDPGRAALLFERGCQAGDLDACVGLAVALPTGSDVATVTEDRMKMERYCLDGSVIACHRTAMQQWSEGLLQMARTTLGKALDRMISGCDQGQPLYCHWAADAVARLGLSSSQIDTRVQRYRMACGEGVGDSCDRLGQFMLSNLIAGGAVEATALFRRACGIGSASGCESLGRVLEKQTASARPPPESIDAYWKACRLADGPCEHVARLLMAHSTDSEAPARSRSLLQKSCAAKRPTACLTLGKLLAGIAPGLPVDRTAATNFLVQACDGGLSDGCGYLGRLQGSREQLERACQLDPLWCYDLAMALLSSADRTDLAKTRTYFGMACKAGCGAACGNYARLTGDSHLEAQARKMGLQESCKPDIPSPAKRN